MMSLKNIVEKYKVKYLEESENLRLLEAQIEEESWESLISRKNFRGHITASAFVVDREKMKCLMIEHRNLSRFLQPWGHVDPEDISLHEAAKREAEEETGIMNMVTVFDENKDPILINIDTHRIPQNSRKEEPAHFHHDFWYVFSAHESELTPNTREVNSILWVDLHDIDRVLGTDKSIARKIMAYMEYFS